MLNFNHKVFNPKIKKYSLQSNAEMVKEHATLDTFINETGKNLKNDEILELIKQVIKELKTLHDFDSIHSEINPKNIEISFLHGNEQMVVMIENFESTSNKELYWKSPESLESRSKVSKEDDIFSLGCVIFFIATGGKHPFNFEIKKISSDNSDLSALESCQNKDENRFYINLIKNMIKPTKIERPTINKVMNHPLFWNPDKIMNFFRVITHFIPKYNNQDLPQSLNIISSQVLMNELMNDLEKRKSEVYKKNNWFEELCAKVQDFERDRIIKKHPHRLGNDKDSLHRLIHYIVDKERHIDEWPIIVPKGEYFIDYFTKKFPYLLIHSYECFKLLYFEDLLQCFY
jgi:serine/threonine-protein kinase/endoribonuclease IRE1